jgi:hypothetical protein
MKEGRRQGFPFPKPVERYTPKRPTPEAGQSAPAVHGQPQQLEHDGGLNKPLLEPPKSSDIPQQPQQQPQGDISTPEPPTAGSSLGAETTDKFSRFAGMPGYAMLDTEEAQRMRDEITARQRAKKWIEAEHKDTDEEDRRWEKTKQELREWSMAEVGFDIVDFLEENLPFAEEVDLESPQGVRSCELRRSRYIGLARTHLQHLMTAAAMNVVRMLHWLAEIPKATTRASPFVRLYQAAA